MSLSPRDWTEIPPDTAALGQRLLKEDNPYRIIGDQLADLFDAAAFTDLYEDTGRYAIPPAWLALMTLFQHVERLPDRAAAELLVIRLDWKYALHVPLDFEGFDFSVLSYFRKRLVNHRAYQRVFERVLAKAIELGFVKARGQQRTDALAVIGAVAQLSELETVSETLRLAVVAVERAAPDWAKRVLTPDFVQKWGHTKPDYRMGKDARAAEFLAIGQASADLLDALAERPAERRPTEVFETLETVFDQRYRRTAEGAVGRRPDPPDSRERIVTPHDPSVRAGQKRGKTWHGDKVHITETVNEDGPNFITDVSTANASSGDAEVLPEIRAHLAERDLVPAEQYVDSGYVSAKQLGESAEAGIELMGPALRDTTPNGFKLDDFAIDRETQQAVCPGGKTSADWRERTNRDGSRAVVIQFAAEDCADCRLRAHCTTSETGRSLTVSEHYELLQARRAEAKTEEFWRRMRKRPGIEGTLSELVRAHGLRRHRYRGEAKRAMENLFKGAACNLKRLVRALAAGQAPALAPAPGR